MLPLLLVLFVAQSAFGASSVLVRTQPIEDAPYSIDDPSSPINANLGRAVFEEFIDASELPFYGSMITTIMFDLANQPDKLSKSVAACEIISIFGEELSGRNGDPCTFAELINAIVEASASGNHKLIKGPLGKYIGRLEYNIDAITSVARNSEQLRYQVGPRGNCAGGGRRYQFESSWDNFLASLNPFQISLANEQYCVSKRLYRAWNENNNLIGAAVTSCSTRPVAQLFEDSLEAVSYFLRTVVHRGNVVEAAAKAKASLVKAYSKF